MNYTFNDTYFFLCNIIHKPMAHPKDLTQLGWATMWVCVEDLQVFLSIH